MNIRIEQLGGKCTSELSCEIVERKGLGHPDTICDSIMEQASQALSREYKRRFGFVLHHNLDKGLLVGGSVEHKLGGGNVQHPILLIFGDRATFTWQDQDIPVQEIAMEAAKMWLKENLRYLDPEAHVKYQMEIRPGSPELQGIFARRKRVLAANDTSAGVGFAPLSDTELVVLETELHLNSPEFKEEFPETGEDVKVMAVRTNKDLDLTIAMPLIDRYVKSEAAYFEMKSVVLNAMREFLQNKFRSFRKINVRFNPLDKKGRGLEGMYLSVLGTSAEQADSGQIGRGNRVSGLISFNRPCSLEAAAGKNAVSHVGKIYNVLAQKMAHDIYTKVDAVSEVTVWLVSRIGMPIDQPALANAKFHLKPGSSFASSSRKVKAIIEKQLSEISSFCEELIRGNYPVV